MNRRDPKLPPEIRMKAVLQEMDEAVVIKSADGSIVLWNRAAAKLFGYTAPEVIGEQGDCLIPPGEIRQWRNFEKQLRGANTVPPRLKVVRVKNGGSRVRVTLKAILADKSRPRRSDIEELCRPLPPYAKDE